MRKLSKIKRVVFSWNGDRQHVCLAVSLTWLSTTNTVKGKIVPQLAVTTIPPSVQVLPLEGTGHRPLTNTHTSPHPLAVSLKWMRPCVFSLGTKMQLMWSDHKWTAGRFDRYYWCLNECNGLSDESKKAKSGSERWRETFVSLLSLKGCCAEIPKIKNVFNLRKIFYYRWFYRLQFYIFEIYLLCCVCCFFYQCNSEWSLPFYNFDKGYS